MHKSFEQEQPARIKVFYWWNTHGNSSFYKKNLIIIDFFSIFILSDDSHSFVPINDFFFLFISK